MISGKMYQLRANPALIASQFLELFLRESHTKKKIDGMKTGISDSGLNLTHDRFRTLTIPLPPLKEQKRIVAKIEELFSELDAGEENLRKARRQLGLYRQSLLKQAFEGKLTVAWRERNKHRLETPAKLRALLRSARQAHFEQQLKIWAAAIDSWQKSRGSLPKPRRPSPPDEIEELPSELIEGLGALPASWFWGRLGSMTLGVEYGTAAKSSETGECPVVRMGNLQNGEIDWNDLVFTSDATEISQYQLTPGDILFNRTNSPELVGKTAIFRGNRRALFAGYLIRVNHIRTVVCSGYLNYFLNSGVARRYGSSVKTDGVNQSNINGAKLAGYPFPYCSLPEQEEIVRILDEQFEIIERNEREIDAALKKSEALRQSILHQAFTGRLVPQDPNDEPASELLARIRAESQTRSSAPGREKKRPAA
jgi:type I restriction enzyme, S subunit